MLKKHVCFKCHMKYYGVDGTDRSEVKCYPPPGEEERKQCEAKFEAEWEDGIVWCFGLDSNATDGELKEILGLENWNIPLLRHKEAVPSKHCDYLEEQNQ